MILSIYYCIPRSVVFYALYGRPRMDIDIQNFFQIPNKRQQPQQLRLVVVVVFVIGPWSDGSVLEAYGIVPVPLWTKPVPGP